MYLINDKILNCRNKSRPLAIRRAESFHHSRSLGDFDKLTRDDSPDLFGSRSFHYSAYDNEARWVFRLPPRQSKVKIDLNYLFSPTITKPGKYFWYHMDSQKYTYSPLCMHFGFWKKNELRENCVSGIVLVIQLTRNSPTTCGYICLNWCKWKLC